jgi:hypothetical protein
MPNWCENHLEICGPEADIAAFKAAAKGEEEFALLLQNLYPIWTYLSEVQAVFPGAWLEGGVIIALNS